MWVSGSAAANRFLDDIYTGQQAIVHDGIVLRRLITSCTGFEREAMNVAVPLGARCLVAGIDLARDADGTYRVLEDNLRNPSGISYGLRWPTTPALHTFDSISILLCSSFPL